LRDTAWSFQVKEDSTCKARICYKGSIYIYGLDYSKLTKPYRGKET
jgi:hypothetical protein